MVELRKESQQSLSPDQLASYIRVSKPSVWLLMSAIAALLVAGAVWFFAGTITENAFGIASVPGDGADAATVYLPLSGASGVEPGDAVTLTRAEGLPSGDSVPAAADDAPAVLTGTVLSVSEVPVSVSEVRVRCAGADCPAFAEDDWAVAVAVALDAPAPDAPALDAPAPDAAPGTAVYNASIATAQHRPIRLLLGLE